MTDAGRRRRALAITTASRRGRTPDPSSSYSHRSHHRRTPTPSFRRSRTSRNPAGKLIRRSSSEPILWTVRFLPESSSQGELVLNQREEGGGIGHPSLYFPRPHTCSDVLLPSLPPLSSPPLPRSDAQDGAAKVVVSVTVEGSPGPVRAMVRLGASVEEAIKVVVDQYGREGRMPKIDRTAAAAFELHHSHFSLQSLSKSDKIGEVGGRSFYLRTSSWSNSFHLGTAGSELTAGSNDIKLANASSPAVVPTHFFMAFIITRLKKIGRRTRKVLKVVACITCL